MLGRFIQFCKDAYEELKKVTWYTRAQMAQSTVMVVILVTIFSIYVGIMDKIIQTVFSLFIVRRI
jgi:preprotein translocase SecE subunit